MPLLRVLVVGLPVLTAALPTGALASKCVELGAHGRITATFVSERERAGGLAERRRRREEARGVGRNVTCRAEEPSGAFDSCVVAKLHFTLTV